MVRGSGSLALPSFFARATVSIQTSPSHEREVVQTVVLNLRDYSEQMCFHVSTGLASKGCGPKERSTFNTNLVKLFNEEYVRAKKYSKGRYKQETQALIHSVVVTMHVWLPLNRVKIELFSREVQIFPGGRILIFFPENVKYRKLLSENCYLALICPKPNPSLILALFQRWSTTALRRVYPPPLLLKLPRN